MFTFCIRALKARELGLKFDQTGKELWEAALHRMYDSARRKTLQCSCLEEAWLQRDIITAILDPDSHH